MPDRMEIEFWVGDIQYIAQGKYEVCPNCMGKGKSSAYLGAFTQSEWDEQGPEFREDYLNGEYDRECETCKGKRVILVIDEERNTQSVIDAYWEYQRELEVDRQISRMEMRGY